MGNGQEQRGLRATAVAATQTEGSSDEDASAARDPDNDTSILKMLFKGNLEERNRSEAQLRKSSASNHKHSYYRKTRCTSTAQEEQGALPAGVLNVFEDSDDDETYTGVYNLFKCTKSSFPYSYDVLGRILSVCALIIRIIAGIVHLPPPACVRAGKWRRAAVLRQSMGCFSGASKSERNRYPWVFAEACGPA